MVLETVVEIALEVVVEMVVKIVVKMSVEMVLVVVVVLAERLGVIEPVESKRLINLPAGSRLMFGMGPALNIAMALSLESTSASATGTPMAPVRKMANMRRSFIFSNEIDNLIRTIRTKFEHEDLQL